MSLQVTSFQPTQIETKASKTIPQSTHTRVADVPRPVFESQSVPLQDQNQLAHHQSFELLQTVSFEGADIQRIQKDNGLASQITQLETQRDELENKSGAIFRVGRLRKMEAQIAELKTDLSSIQSRETMSNRAGIAIDMIDFYSEHAHDYAEQANPPTLDIEKGMEVVYAKMMANAAEPEKNEQMIALASRLIENPNTELSRAERQLLQDYGLIINDGVLTNYASGETVTAQDIADFAQINSHQNQKLDEMEAVQGVRPAMGPRRNSASNMIQMAQLAERFLLDRQDDLSTRLSALSAQRERLETTLDTGKKQLKELESQSNALSIKMQQANATLETLNGLENAEDLGSFILNSTQTQQAQLREMGLDFEIQGDQVIFQSNGNEVHPLEALNILRNGVQAQREALQTEIAQTQAQLQELEASVQATETSLLELEHLEAGVRQSQNELTEATGDYQQRMNDLRALRDDPVAWAALTDEQRAEITALLGRSEENLTRSTALQTAAHQELAAVASLKEEARDFIHAAQAQISASQAIIQAAGEVAYKLDQMIHRLDKLIEKQQSSEIQSNVGDLIARANELASRVELAPSFKQSDVSELIQEWEKILKETRETYSRWNQDSLTHDQIENSRMQAYSERMLERADYHLEMLQSMALESGEELRNYLQRNIQGLVRGLERAA